MVGGGCFHLEHGERRAARVADGGCLGTRRPGDYSPVSMAMERSAKRSPAIPRVGAAGLGAAWKGWGGGKGLECSPAPRLHPSLG